jgi:hypothetical protein
MPLLFEHGRKHFIFVDRFCAKRSENRLADENVDPIGEAEELLDFTGEIDNGAATVGETTQFHVEIALCGQINAAGWVVEDDTFGWRANARAIRTFCWFPPDREVILFDGRPILIRNRLTSG